MADVYVPNAWPAAVAPPDSQDWEATATAFPVKFFCSRDLTVLDALGPSSVTPA